MLAYPASAGHGRQVHPSGQHSQWNPHLGTLRELKLFAFFLLALNPDGAFNPSSPASRILSGNPELAVKKCMSKDRWRAASGSVQVFMAQTKKKTASSIGGFGGKAPTLEEVTAAFKTRKPKDLNVACPCGTGDAYSSCCMPYHLYERSAETPERLLRSRYTAWCFRDLRYICETTSKSMADLKKCDGDRIKFAKFLDKAGAFDDFRFDGLEVVGDVETGKTEKEAYLGLRAHLMEMNRTTKEPLGDETILDERSLFRKNKKGKWFYVGAFDNDGEGEDK
mmetsp:Transcript_160301/g.282840  ORF Transcript_160301/g.282840 Transcript_160301/m.282840 type:complete len:280 (+) Transcript_160301:95-934(+)